MSYRIRSRNGARRPFRHGMDTSSTALTASLESTCRHRFGQNLWQDAPFGEQI